MLLMTIMIENLVIFSSDFNVNSRTLNWAFSKGAIRCNPAFALKNSELSLLATLIRCHFLFFHLAFSGRIVQLEYNVRKEHSFRILHIQKRFLGVRVCFFFFFFELIFAMVKRIFFGFLSVSVSSCVIYTIRVFLSSEFMSSFTLVLLN